MTSQGSVCVIGAQGVLGKVVMEQFASAGWTVYPAGRRPDQRDGFRQIDLDRHETVGPALQDVDLVISTVPDHGYTAERTILDQGGVLVNCSHARARVASELAAKREKPKGTVLLNSGLVPGITNLAAAELLARHPQADCLEVAFTVLNEGTAGSTGGLFAFEGLTSRSHHRVVKLPLPRPFGDLACIEIGEGDDYGFEGVAGTRRVENFLGFGDAPLSLGLQLVNLLRLMRLLPKVAFTSERGQEGAVTREPTAVWVGAKQGNERLGSSILECEGDYRTTAEAARVFGEKLVLDSQPGCFNPEDLFAFSDVLPILEREGLRISPGAPA